MSGLLINNVLYGVGGGGGECSGLTEITYAEYLANKAEYDASGKAYAIPDYPSSGGYDPTKYTRLEGTNCVVFYNDFDVVIHITASGLNLTGGNTDAQAVNKVATLPSNVTVNFIQVTNSVDVMDSSWTPTGNTMVMNINNSSIFGRCRTNATNGVIVQTVTLPRYLVSIT